MNPTFIPARQTRDRFGGISVMTEFRWRRDGLLPTATMMNGRNFDLQHEIDSVLRARAAGADDQAIRDLVVRLTAQRHAINPTGQAAEMVAAAGPRGDRGQIEQSIGAADLALDADLNQQIAVLPVPGDIDSIPSHPPGGARLSRERARQLTDSIRIDAQGLRAMLLRSFEGDAHGVLGYASFGEYAAAEFGMSARTAYRSLNAGRVDLILSDQLDTDGAPLKEALAREMTPLLDDPGELRETYRVAVDTAPRDVDGTPKITAAHVRETVAGQQPPREIAITILRDAEPSSRPPRPEAPTVTCAIAQAILTIKSAASTEDIQKTVIFALKTLEKRRNGTPPGALADGLRDVLKVLCDLYGRRP